MKRRKTTEIIVETDELLILRMIANTTGDSLTIKLLADFPDYVPDPRFPGDPNVRNSHPYALELIGTQLYVVDSGFNSVRRVDIQTGANDTLTTFAPIPNTGPPPPPVVEAVPTSIRQYNNQLLVSLFRGFPFPQGKAEVRKVDPATSSNDSFINGLSSAIDVLPLCVFLGFSFFRASSANLPVAVKFCFNL